jgi:adhesin/invasin
MFALFANNSGAILTTLSGTTDIAGRAVAVYTAGATNPTVSVQDTIQANITGSTGAVIITRTGSSTTAYAVSIGASTTSVTAGQVSVITATVTSGSTAAGGVTVTFSLPVNSSGATLSPFTATTDGSGKAVVTYQPGTTSPTLSVQDTVQAAVGGTAANTVVITRVGSAASAYGITVTAAPTTLATKGSNSVITATVTNSAGTAISGVTVNFAVTGVLPVGTLSVASATTDGSGNAVTTFTGNGAGATGATSVVTASITVSGNTYTSAVIITYP